MSTPPEPAAPDSLPKYLVEGLPKQDNKTLKDTQAYIEALLHYREQLAEEPLREDDLAELLTSAIVQIGPPRVFPVGVDPRGSFCTSDSERGLDRGANCPDRP